MPDANIEIAATYNEVPPDLFVLEVINGSGDGEYAPGTVVEVSATPREAAADVLSALPTVVDVSVFDLVHLDDTVEETHHTLVSRICHERLVLGSSFAHPVDQNILQVCTYVLLQKDQAKPSHSVVDQPLFQVMKGRLAV